MNTYTTDQPPLDSFELALLGQLRQEVVSRAAEASPPTRSRRPLGVAVAAVAAATVAVVGFTTFGSTAGAYAVDSGADGSITITIHRLDDAAGLQQDLADHGIKADVDYQALGSTTGPGSQPKIEQVNPSSGSDGALQQQGSGTFSATAPSSGSSSSGQPPAGTSPCGDPSDPALTTTMSGDDYVITIPKASVLHQADSALRITTTGDLKDSVAGINVNYSVNGADCGFGTVSASSGAGSVG